AALMFDKLNEAQLDFEQALSLLNQFDTQPSMQRAAMRAGLGFVCRGRADFVEAERYYLLAVDDYIAIEDWEKTVDMLHLAAFSSMIYGNPSGFLSHIDKALDLAKARQLSALERQLWLHKFQLQLDSDPSGEAMQKMKEELSHIKSVAGDNGFLADFKHLEVRYL